MDTRGWWAPAPWGWQPVPGSTEHHWHLPCWRRVGGSQQSKAGPRQRQGRDVPKTEIFPRQECSQGKALSWSQVMPCMHWEQRKGLRVLPMAEPPLLWVPGNWQPRSPAPRSGTEVIPALGHTSSCREPPQGASHLALSRAGRGREEARTSIPRARSHQPGGKGDPGLGPQPAPGQSVPSIPAAWGRPILGTPIVEGSKPPQSRAGSPAAGRDRSLLGKGRRARRRAPCSTSRSQDLPRTPVPFPFEKGEKVEFYSFLPLRPRRLGGSLLAMSSSALPLPPLLAPLTPGSP